MSDDTAEGRSAAGDELRELPAGSRTPGALADIRDRRRRRLVALVAGALVGIALVWVHWLGLFVAGALVGLASRTLPRALIAGLAVGVLVLAVQVVAIPGMDPGEFFALGQAADVTAAAALIAPVWGSLVRGVL